MKMITGNYDLVSVYEAVINGRHVLYLMSGLHARVCTMKFMVAAVNVDNNFGP